MGARQVSVHPDDFRPEKFEFGTKQRVHLEFGDSLGFPVVVVRGEKSGPTLVTSANVHGDEYEGVRAILETFEALDPGIMRGDWIGVPVLNVPAFWNGSRTSPLDGANLARVFPGSPDGTPSQQIAWHFAHSVMLRADFYLDLHSGGVRLRMPSMAGYPAENARARAAAEVFGARVIWGHPSPVDPGRTVSFASDHGIPWLYTEARGAGRIHPEDLAMMKRGIRNLLSHLGILPAESLESIPIETRLFGAGNTDAAFVARHDGFLLNEVAILQPVNKGDLLGRLVDLNGEALEEYRSPAAGIVAMTREFPVVRAGDGLYLLADEDKAA
jgi:N-alpha-acetyl-L-2,4-diaminobutyrate deacetylase